MVFREMINSHRYSILKRILFSFIMFIALVVTIFFFMHLLPGDPFQSYISPKLGDKLAVEMKSSFGLDKPIYIQFYFWLKNTLTGNLGYSIVYKRAVIDILIESISVTLLISISAFILQILITIPMSLFLLKHKNKFIDIFIDRLSLIIYSAPSFVVAIILIYFGSIILKIFPSSQLYSFNFYELSISEKFLDLLHHITLPILTLTITSVVFSLRYLRESLIQVSNQPFVINLRASGIPEKIIRMKHILPNALISYITILGLEIGALLSKTLITETVFSLPGIGRLMVSSIFTRDYPLIIATVLLSGLMVIIGNLIADILLARFNPRFSHEVIS